METNSEYIGAVLGVYWGYIGVTLGLYCGFIGVILEGYMEEYFRGY